jgi:hypothetical protein
MTLNREALGSGLGDERAIRVALIGSDPNHISVEEAELVNRSPVLQRVAVDDETRELGRHTVFLDGERA